MNDTPPHVERLRMASGMFDTATALIRASLGAPASIADSAEMRVRLFYRIYGPDFDARTAARIAMHLRGALSQESATPI